MNTYTVIKHFTSAREIVTDNARSLVEAKRVAADSWRAGPAMMIEIIAPTGQTLTATQAIGRGMLWTN